MLEIEILESSFKKIEPKINDFATSFYENLFTMYPEAKPLFTNTDMEAQKQKLIDSLKAVILNIRYGESLSQLLNGLGTRHVQYGALPEHYPAVGNALLETFAQYLGEEWTPEIKQAWVEAYQAITELMLEGADYSQEQVDLDSVFSVQKEANLTEEISLVSPEKETNLNPEIPLVTSPERAISDDNLEKDSCEIEAEDAEESQSNNQINLGILIGIVAVLMVGLMAVILPQLQKAPSPSSQPNESLSK